MKKKFQPIFIIGAPRSGTNILRDCLSISDAIATWPCDEINYIWKYGNASFPTDQLSVSQLTPKIEKYIRSQFTKLSNNDNARFVLEKTCANCLRVDYINEIFPEAKYIYIYRDGIDCTASAIKRWKAKFDLSYTLKKVSYVPKVDLPYYFFKFLKNRLFKLFSKEKRLAFWGPNFDGMSELLKRHDSTMISAYQWEKCNQLALDSFAKIDSERVHTINYADLAEDPVKVISQITSYLELEENEAEPIKSFAVENIRKSSVGKGYKEIAPSHLIPIKALIDDTMKRLDLNKNID